MRDHNLESLYAISYKYIMSLERERNRQKECMYVCARAGGGTMQIPS